MITTLSFTLPVGTASDRKSSLKICCQKVIGVSLYSMKKLFYGSQQKREVLVKESYPSYSSFFLTTSFPRVSNVSNELPINIKIKLNTNSTAMLHLCFDSHC